GGLWLGPAVTDQAQKQLGGIQTMQRMVVTFFTAVVAAHAEQHHRAIADIAVKFAVIKLGGLGQQAVIAIQVIGQFFGAEAGLQAVEIFNFNKQYGAVVV